MIKKKQYRLRRITPKTAQKKKIRSEKLSVYYDTLIEQCEICAESKIPIYNPSRINVCHLLPKRIYKSVEADLDNHIFFLAEIHSRFDSLMDRLDFETLEKEFNSWGLICERVRGLLPKVLENKRLKMKFIDYLNVTNYENFVDMH